MTPRRGLFVRLLRSTFADFLPSLFIIWVLNSVNNGLTWSTAGEAALLVPVQLLFALAWAAWRTRSMERAARGLGVEVSVHALDGIQAHTLTGVPLSRVRAGLGAAPRAVETGGGNPVRFRWRPFRSRVSADGTVAYEESTGETRVEVRAGRRLRSDSVFLRGAVFIALCQVVRTLEDH
ncbi:hypothetical protein [Streptomyces sp. NPDC093970]|uniref:hypothetical protein n=1 Tax=Streptomyces sp. NPDC093970 TaxID=3155076 RepID=UPI00342BD22E